MNQLELFEPPETVASPTLLRDVPIPGANDEIPAATERDMLDLLHLRYSHDYGNGQRYACAEHVRNAAGFDGNRTADFIAMDLWPSKGLELHGHEVKVSRADWLRELADPAKAEAFMRYMDRWWLVVPNSRIVRDDLPTGWGLMVRHGGRLVQAVAAPKLHPDPIPRSLMAALMRAAVVTTDRRAVRRINAERAARIPATERTPT